MIKTIIFDLSEVYLKGIKGIENHLSPILNLSNEEIKKVIYNQDLERLFHCEITENEYIKNTIEKGSWKIEIGLFKELIRKNFEEIDGTRKILEELKKNGYKLGLLSVHSKEWVEYLEKKFDYHKLFDSIIYSFEISISKPDKKAYQHILEKLNSKPEDCLFIDDMIKNTNAAKELGINVIVFKSAEQLKNEIKDFGINIR